MFANIKNILSAIGAIKGLLGLIQPITDLITQIETSGFSGPDKKAAVLALIQSTIITVESAFSISLPDALVLGFAGNIIDVIVSVQNMLGRFIHSGTPQPVSVANVTTSAGVPIVAKAAAAGAKAAVAAPLFPPTPPPPVVSENF